jgi:hypothetical protein
LNYESRISHLLSRLIHLVRDRAYARPHIFVTLSVITDTEWLGSSTMKLFPAFTSARFIETASGVEKLLKDDREFAVTLSNSAFDAMAAPLKSILALIALA